MPTPAIVMNPERRPSDTCDQFSLSRAGQAQLFGKTPIVFSFE
jgi:hypothetical protein